MDYSAKIEELLAFPLQEVALAINEDILDLIELIQSEIKFKYSELDEDMQGELQELANELIDSSSASVITIEFAEQVLNLDGSAYLSEEDEYQMINNLDEDERVLE